MFRLWCCIRLHVSAGLLVCLGVLQSCIRQVGVLPLRVVSVHLDDCPDLKLRRLGFWCLLV